MGGACSAYSLTPLVFCPCQVSHPRERSKVTMMSVIDSCSEVPVRFATSLQCTSNRLLGTGKRPARFQFSAEYFKFGTRFRDRLKKCERYFPNWQLPYISPSFVVAELSLGLYQLSWDLYKPRIWSYEFAYSFLWTPAIKMRSITAHKTWKITPRKQLKD
jgi:hypothetical protein